MPRTGKGFWKEGLEISAAVPAYFRSRATQRDTGRWEDNALSCGPAPHKLYRREIGLVLASVEGFVIGEEGASRKIDGAERS